MVTIKQSEDDYYFLHALSEQSKCPRMLLRGNLPGITIPLYLLGSHSALENGASGWLFSTLEEEQSLLDSLLLAQWEDHAWKGHLRYDVTTCEMKVIDGKSKFVAQLNEIEDNKVLQKQDPLTFKCLKTHREPLLFCVSSGEKTNPEFIHSATVPDDATLIIVNANPVEYGHVFLVPHGLNSHLQFMDARSLEMVTRVAVEINNCSFRVFYDYLTSSADHPSFQACYFANCLPVELMPAVTIYGDHCGRGIQICDIKDYPMEAFLFKGNGNLKALVEVVAEICSCLQDQTIPYSLLISDCGTKMFLFPQVRPLAMACGLSAWECGGYIVFKERCEFDQATEEDVLKRLSTFSLEDERFSVVKQLCCSVASKLAT